MRRYLFLLLCLVLTACQQSPEMKGNAEVKDGDSLVLNGVTQIRLWGIDAPEYEQNCYLGNDRLVSCGLMANDYLKMLVEGQKITCYQKDIDRYQRIVAICYNQDNIELNEAMVAGGWALDYTSYSGARYRVIEYRAKQEKLGIWNYMFDFPEDWRKTNRESVKE